MKFKDATGLVLPGVTVEASSPALIEKVRTVVTDANGRYQITDLRPGTYVVTFTLPGFNAVRREGLELNTGFTASVNADLQAGRRRRNDHRHRFESGRGHHQRPLAERADARDP